MISPSETVIEKVQQWLEEGGAYNLRWTINKVFHALLLLRFTICTYDVAPDSLSGIRAVHYPSRACRVSPADEARPLHSSVRYRYS